MFNSIQIAQNEQYEKVFKAIFAIFLSAVRYFIFVHNANWVHRRQNYSAIATNVKCWHKHFKVPTVSNGPLVCLGRELRCWLT